MYWALTCTEWWALHTESSPKCYLWFHFTDEEPETGRLQWQVKITWILNASSKPGLSVGKPRFLTTVLYCLPRNTTSLCRTRTSRVKALYFCLCIGTCYTDWAITFTGIKCLDKEESKKLLQPQEASPRPKRNLPRCCRELTLHPFLKSHKASPVKSLEFRCPSKNEFFITFFFYISLKFF